jgi:hypothetical protein
VSAAHHAQGRRAGRTLKKFHRALILVLVPLLAVGIVTSDRIAAVPLVKRGIWIGAYSPPSPWESMARVYNLERSIGRRLDVVHLYKAWGESWGQYNTETIRELLSATADGRRTLITGSIAMDVDERCVVWRGARWVGRTGVI